MKAIKFVLRFSLPLDHFSLKCVQVLEEENANLSGQVALLEDQLKMASVASSRKMEDAQQKHRELGLKLRELLKLHENLASHLAA